MFLPGPQDVTYTLLEDTVSVGVLGDVTAGELLVRIHVVASHIVPQVEGFLGLSGIAVGVGSRRVRLLVFIGPVSGVLVGLGPVETLDVHGSKVSLQGSDIRRRVDGTKSSPKVSGWSEGFVTRFTTRKRVGFLSGRSGRKDGVRSVRTAPSFVRTL